ncbi:MAG: glycosyltransferase family 4 protein [Chitinivibrionales bacterium]
MKNRLKVLHVINSLSIGGAETLVANSLAPGGLNEHADNTLVYFRGDSYLSSIIDKNVTKICLNYAGWFEIIRVLGQLRKIIGKNRFDIIHTHLNPISFYTYLVCPSAIPLVHTLHTTYSMNVRSRRIMVFLEKQLYFKSRKCNIICLSDSAKEDLLRSVPFKGKVFVLNNFVADKFFANPIKKFGSEKSVLKIVAVGSLEPLKNFEYLLDVFTYFKNEEIYLDIYGKGDKSKYEEIIKSKALKVRMMGENTNIAEALKEYDLFIMPSKYEGFPLSLFEAMASGLPVMVSNIAPLRSIVKDNGIYFDLDNAEATANIIKSILLGKTDINSLAEKAKRYAEQILKRENYIKRLLGIYEQLLTAS